MDNGKGRERRGALKALPAAEILQPAAVALLTLAVLLPFLRLGVDAHHDGIVLKPALDAASGQTLFRDTFSQYGALLTLLQAAALKIAGETLLALRLQAALFYAGAAWLLWHCWRRLIPGPLATAGGAAFALLQPSLIHYVFFNRLPNYSWWFLPWSSVYALFFQALTLLLLLRWLEKERPRDLLLAGAAAALTMWTRQPVGALLAAACAAVLAVLPLLRGRPPGDSLRPLALFGAGFALVCAAFCAWLLAAGAFGDMWRQNVLYPYRWAGITSSGSSWADLFSMMLPGGMVNKSMLPIPQAPSYVWMLLPLTCLYYFGKGLLAAAGKGAAGPRGEALFAAAAVGLASWAQYFPVEHCERHMFWAAAPMIGLFPALVLDLFPPERRRLAGAAALTALVLLVQPDITRRIIEGRYKLGQPYEELQAPPELRGLRLPPHDALFFRVINAETEDYLAANPAGAVLNSSQDALLSVFGPHRPNFHPLQFYWSGGALPHLYPDYERARDSFAASARPLVFSHRAPLLYEGYTITAYGRDLFVTAPAKTGSAWRLTGFMFTGPEPPLEDVDPVREYLAELRPEAGVLLKELAVEARDYQGELKGVWLPETRQGGEYYLKYLAAPPENYPRPASAALRLRAGEAVRLRLKGHDFRHYSTPLKLLFYLKDGSGGRSVMPLNLPPLFAKTAVRGSGKI
jgi:hypothetical protein